LHNNHHAAPTSARLSHRRGELDPGWWIISLLASVRGAKVRLSEPKLVRAAQASAP
jgi:stearoyl-CoA desaturase (delta-9 desaturase)